MFQNSKIIARDFSSPDYHKQEAKRGDQDYFVSPSSLKEFSRCAARWFAGYESPSGSSQKWGNLMDCRLLTPDQFPQRYAVRPPTYLDEGMKCPKCGSVTDAKSCRKCGVDREKVSLEKDWNANAEFCAKWAVMQTGLGREIVGQGEVNECDEAIATLDKDPLIKAFLDASNRQVMVQGEWHDEKTELVIPVRCLIDLEPRADTEFSKCLGDLKTTFNCGPKFSRHAHAFGYHFQAAFDLDLYTAATGEDRNTWCLIAQESFKPWQPGRKMFSEDFIEIGRANYRRALANYAWCVKNSHWPDYDDNDESCQGWTLLAPEPWMESESLFAPRFANDQAACEPEQVEDFLH